jgi:RNA polymerase sigma-70 factor (ECF subfamily)
LERLKKGDDTEGWKEFYRVYGKLVHDFSIRAGLTDTEADEVVQETAIAMARHLPEYRYDPKVCRFKTWLLNQASWRIKDQVKKRKKNVPGAPAPVPGPSATSGGDTARTSTLERVPDPTAPGLDQLFETEWRNNLFAMALERVRENFSLKQFQIFDLAAIKEWPAADVARSLGVTVANVYVTRHRFLAAIKRETRRLEEQLEQTAKRHGCQTQPDRKLKSRDRDQSPRG